MNIADVYVHVYVCNTAIAYFSISHIQEYYYTLVTFLTKNYWEEKSLLNQVHWIGGLFHY
jgi:hypothetical protein